MGSARSLIALALLATAVSAQSVRDRTRPSETTVSEQQAVELTLTVLETQRRPLQTWVRTAGTLDDTGRVLVADVPAPEADLVQVGQRARAFPPQSKSSMTQAKVRRVTKLGDRARVEAALPVAPSYDAAHYVMEIVVDRGTFLAVPNEAIIDEGDREVVYVELGEGQYAPRDIRTGLKGELYAEVLEGLEEGDRVVTFGSFFIDSEHKLKGTEPDPGAHAHHHH